MKVILTLSLCSRPDEIYHVTVMPCYDKKLEASREDFGDADRGTRDVDCVLTTGELDRMMHERGWTIEERLSDEDDAISRSAEDLDYDALPELLDHPGSSAGSYMHALLVDAAITASAKEGGNIELALQTRQVRGADFEEVRLVRKHAEGREETLVRAARCYGFRNLQNLVRRVARDSTANTQPGAGPARRGAAAKLAERRAAKRREREKEGGSTVSGDKAGSNTDASEGAYDYVEVMACPGGCVNGGGQLRPASATAGADNANLVDKEAGVGGDPARWGDRAWTARVERAYWHGLPTPPPSPPANTIPLSHFGEQQSAKVTEAVAAAAQTFPEPLDIRLASATSLALRVLSEMCLPESDFGAESDKTPTSWAASLPPAAEAQRLALFRTTYRAVQADVPGIAVQW